jgi:hypothetical protein
LTEPEKPWTELVDVMWEDRACQVRREKLLAFWMGTYPKNILGTGNNQGGQDDAGKDFALHGMDPDIFRLKSSQVKFTPKITVKRVICNAFDAIDFD